MKAAVTWLALALAVLLAPCGNPVVERVRSLSERGRLRRVRSHRARRRYVPRAVRLGSPPLAGVIVASAVTLRYGPALGVAAGLVVASAVRAAAEFARRRIERRSRTELLAAVRLMVAELDAGAGLPAAVRAAAEASPVHATELRDAADTLQAGDSAVDVLLADPALAPIAHAWRVAAVCGTPLAAVLARVAADLAAAQEQGDAVATALAGPRSSAGVLAGLPLLGILLGVALDAHPMRFLLAGPTGQTVLLVGVVLDLAGIAWTRRLAAGAEAAT